MNLHIQHHCRCEVADITPRLQQLAERLQQKWSIQMRPDASGGWQLHGRGVEGRLEQQGPELRLSLRLGLLLRPMAGRIEQGIREKLEELF